MRRTGLIIIAVAVVAGATLLAFDLYWLLSGGVTISQWANEIAYISPIIPFLVGTAFGLVVGHTWWPIYREKK